MWKEKGNKIAKNRKKRASRISKKSKKKYAAIFFHLKIKITPLCCEPLFFKNCDKTFFRKKKLDILKMSKKNILKILLQQNFCKTPKYPLFTIENTPIL
jgi:hypothetical protein